MRAQMIFRILAPLLIAFPLAALAGTVGGGPTGLLNDTGVTQCYDGSTLTACTSANTGDSASYPRQDARFGRDAAAAAGQMTKTGGGAAGFDFTPLDASGNAIALDANHHPVSTPTCVKDNVTNLIWQADGSSDGIKTWSAAQTFASTFSLCGYSSGWRLPTRSELLSIVDNGTNSPAIDTNFFPNTVSDWYWTSDVYAPDPSVAWGVVFNDGGSNAVNQANSDHVRLVRSGQ